MVKRDAWVKEDGTINFVGLTQAQWLYGLVPKERQNKDVVEIATNKLTGVGPTKRIFWVNACWTESR